MAVDQETLQILGDGEELKLITTSKGWDIVLGKFKDKILDLQLIGNVTGATSDEKVKNMEARAMAVDIIWGVLNEVTGIVRNHDTTKQALMDAPADGFVDRSLESGTSGQ